MTTLPCHTHARAATAGGQLPPADSYRRRTVTGGGQCGGDTFELARWGMAAPPWLRRQLSGPHGWLARPMARLLNRVNRDEYVAALQHLDARHGERVLELGFGGGIGVQALLSAGAHVVASEPAVAMRARAHRRFAWALAEGRLEIWPHGAEDLPPVTVNRALSMNTVFFWRDVDAGFANLARMVTKRVVIGVVSPDELEKGGFHLDGRRLEEPAWYADKLTQAGFDTKLEPVPDGVATLIIGTPTSATA